MANVERLLYTRKVSAEMLSISPRSLDYLISQKRINTRRVGRLVMITRTELFRFASKNHPESMSGR